MVLLPTARGMGFDAVPLAVGIPFTVMVAVVSESVGVAVMLVVELDTVSAYSVMPLLNAGDKVPSLTVRSIRFAFELGALITFTM